ncbi:MAG: hypothetical protein NVSMB44_16100 [Ktedonobacteraceae bacterium]
MRPKRKRDVQHYKRYSTLFKRSCERRLIAASESATDETDQADRLRRTETATQALSLTQLNGTLFKSCCERCSSFKSILIGTLTAMWYGEYYGVASLEKIVAI